MRLSSLFIVLPLVAACGPKVDTGRNDTPSQWGNDSNANGQGGPGNTSGSGDKTQGSHSNDSGNDQGKNDNGKNGGGDHGSAGGQNNGSAISCFNSGTNSLAPSLVKICAEQIQPNPLLSKTNQYICGDGKLIATMDLPACGWQGDQASISQFTHVYERTTEESGLDYEDTHATIVHIPITATKFANIDRMAFEDYAAFKAAGYQWIAGTREIANLNGGKLDTGLNYRIRIDKDVYELGQAGHVQMFQLDDKTWLQLNYGNADFVRVKSFEQAVIYHDLGDGSAMVVKFEHKAIESKNLYRRAWKGAIELMQDFMTKTWTNALKGKNS